MQRREAMSAGGGGGKKKEGEEKKFGSVKPTKERADGTLHPPSMRAARCHPPPLTAPRPVASRRALPSIAAALPLQQLALPLSPYRRAHGSPSP